jgi:hypothetical protein
MWGPLPKPALSEVEEPALSLSKGAVGWAQPGTYYDLPTHARRPARLCFQSPA